MQAQLLDSPPPVSTNTRLRARQPEITRQGPKHLIVRAFFFVLITAILTLVGLFISNASTFAFAIAGCTFGLSSCIAVFVHAALVPCLRRHPNTLLLFKTAVDFVIAMRFLWNPIIETHCRGPATLLTFCTLAAEGWMLCVALDFWQTISNPFTSYRVNMKFVYHPFCWGLGTIGGAIMLFNPDAAGPMMQTPNSKDSSKDNWCWFKSRNDRLFQLNWYAWALFYLPMAIMVAGSFLICVAGVLRLRHGLAETFLPRANVALINLSATTIGLAYWIVFVCFHIVHYAVSSIIFKRAILFLLASGGVVDLLVWIVAYQFRNRTSSTGDDDVAPQANEALQTEFINYITVGITQAFAQAERSEPSWQRNRHTQVMLPAKGHRISWQLIIHHRFNLNAIKREMEAATLADPTSSVTTASTLASFPGASPSMPLPLQGVVVHDSSTPVNFYELERESFRRVRICCQVTKHMVASELSHAVKPRFTEGGASGAVFFFSSNNRFIVKSVSSTEALFWTRSSGTSVSTHAERYAQYIQDHPDTYLTKVFGVFVLEIYGTKFYILLMDNIFRNKNVTIHEMYDLKGSWVQRSAEKPREGESVTCRLCNMRFTFTRIRSKRQQCRYAPHHEPKKVFKDNDLKYRMRLAQPAQLVKQLDQDTLFLCDEFGTMDYSLLVGVHKQDKAVQMQPQWGNCLLAQRVQGPACYYVGLIDLLQEWTWRKKLERFIKTVWYRHEAPGISAQPPRIYRERFMRAMKRYTNHPSTSTSIASIVHNRTSVVNQTNTLNQIHTSNKASGGVVSYAVSVEDMDDHLDPDDDYNYDSDTNTVMDVLASSRMDNNAAYKAAVRLSVSYDPSEPTSSFAPSSVFTNPATSP